MRIKKSGNFEEEIQKIDEQIRRYTIRINQLKEAKLEYMQKIEREKIMEIKELMDEKSLSVDDIREMLLSKDEQTA